MGKKQQGTKQKGRVYMEFLGVAELYRVEISRVRMGIGEGVQTVGMRHRSGH